VPSRKQRRRREKLKRHEYEYVLETDDGEEVVLDRPTPETARTNGKARSDAAPKDRRGREIPKPTLTRVLRRTAIFAPLILVVVFLTSGKSSTTAEKVYTAVMLLAFFIPFSYLVDVVMYRMMTRRQERARATRG
jgi:hypothetical protein